MTRSDSVMITITIMQCNALDNFSPYQVIHVGTSETRAGGHTYVYQWAFIIPHLI